jgi:hypothetical protein
MKLGQGRTKHPDDSHFLARRAAKRARIKLPASIRTITGQREVSLLDLSGTGAMLEGKDLPEMGHDVVLKSGNLDVLGVVVWCRNGRCGVTFDQPIAEEEVHRHWLEGIKTSHLGIAPEVREAAKDWVEGRIR